MLEISDEKLSSKSDENVLSEIYKNKCRSCLVILDEFMLSELDEIDSSEIYRSCFFCGTERRMFLASVSLRMTHVLLVWELQETKII